ncbi:uncharacterized protein LOC119573414 [Penaeus monodon]|uniref:uncharacterized protein LOC119573414 n=1 Tax=Penaeus monodon TaxID=6687 RepID=UPI0018A70566|nr:uncharacterized protein LOC119573414 [Penaeus monodon]
MYSFLCGFSTTKFLVLVVLLAVSLPGSDSIKVLEIQVPPRVPTGETVRLGCLYDLEGANLYSLTWWRGTEQFYQFSPSSQEQMTVYDSPGITVDRNRSSRDEVVLRNVSHASAGRYKCEVLADFPSYEKDSQITSMEVIVSITSDQTETEKWIMSLLWGTSEVLRNLQS